MITGRNKRLEVPFIGDAIKSPGGMLSTVLDQLARNAVDQVCWHKLKHKLQIEFSIGYNREAMYVKFYVTENAHSATFKQHNEPVYKDSCVEFFIAIDDSGNYYNFEFNSLGACLASYGKDRHARIKLDEQLIATIETTTVWRSKLPERNLYQWEITVAFTPAVFYFNNIQHFAPDSYKANFYKCGDDLPIPHYLSWNPVTSTVVDFHQSRYFGVLHLI